MTAAVMVPFMETPRAGSALPVRPTPGRAARAMDVSLTVFRADTLRVLPGAAVGARLISYDAAGVPAPEGGTTLGEGVTDAGGRFTLHLEVPAPSEWKGIRFRISPGPGGPDFPAKSLDVPGSLPDGARSTAQAVAVCPDGADALACEVGERQLLFSQVLDGRLAAWRYEDSGRPSKVMEFALDAAHSAVMDRSGPVRNGTLARHWEALSWAVCDLGIPPADWPELVEWYDRTWTILEDIPWPASADVRRAFRSCAEALPLGLTAKGVGDFRLYSRTFCDYFPREDRRVRADLAASFLLNLHLIFGCMVRSSVAGAEGLQRERHRLAGIRLAAASVSAPMAGRAMPGPLVTDRKGSAMRAFGHRPPGGVMGLVAGLSKDAQEGAGMGALLAEIVDGADPAVRKTAEMLGPGLAEAAAREDPAWTPGAPAAPAAFGGPGAHVDADLADFVRHCGPSGPEGRLCAEVTPFILWCVEAMRSGGVVERAGARGV